MSYRITFQKRNSDLLLLSSLSAVIEHIYMKSAYSQPLPIVFGTLQQATNPKGQLALKFASLFLRDRFLLAKDLMEIEQLCAIYFREYEKRFFQRNVPKAVSHPCPLTESIQFQFFLS